MPSAKLRYVIDGQAWLRISEAARLLGSTPQTIRKWMGNGTLEWRQLRMNSKTLLVEEASVLRLRSERAPRLVEARRTAADPLRTAAERRTSQLHVPPAPGVLSAVASVRAPISWDPSPTVPPISGRDSLKPKDSA